MFPLQILPCSYPDTTRAHRVNDSLYPSVGELDNSTQLLQSGNSVMAVLSFSWHCVFDAVPVYRMLEFLVSPCEGFNGLPQSFESACCYLSPFDSILMLYQIVHYHKFSPLWTFFFYMVQERLSLLVQISARQTDIVKEQP